MTYEDLLAALTEFGLPEQVSLKAVRERHRELVKKHHPDQGASSDNDKIRRINAAYKVLNDYIGQYRFDFSRDVFLSHYPEERLREQFYDVGLWGEKG